MRTLRKLSKLAAVAAAAGCLAFTGTSAAVADEKPAPQRGLCGTGVFLDGLRALATTKEFDVRDEVYITANGIKIWPANALWVTMLAGQRVEVDKCVSTNSTRIQLWEYDDFDPNDNIGGFTLHGEFTGNGSFCCGQGANYRIGIIA